MRHLGIRYGYYSTKPSRAYEIDQVIATVDDVLNDQAFTMLFYSEEKPLNEAREDAYRKMCNLTRLLGEKLASKR